MGKLSKVWLVVVLQPSYINSKGKTRDSHLWGAIFIEICLWNYINLCKQRNKDLHSHTKIEQALVLVAVRAKLTTHIRTMYTLQNHIRYNDDHLFPPTLRSNWKFPP